MASYPAIQVANTFIERYGSSGIDHLKLQKLVYYAYGWWLALQQSEPPLTNVRPQVWKLGPVFKPIYAAFADFRDQPINKLQSIGPFSAASYVDADAQDRGSLLIDWIWGRYGVYHGTTLSNMTHEPGTPWYTIAQRHDFVVPRFLEMSDDEIRPYFIDLARKDGFIR